MRLTLADLRSIVLDELRHDEWVTATQLCRRLELGAGLNHYRVALVLERLAADGLADLKTPGTTIRKFRRRA